MKKPKLCAGCGKPLGKAILEVRTVLVGMPVGTYHASGGCYTKALAKVGGSDADGDKASASD